MNKKIMGGFCALTCMIGPLPSNVYAATSKTQSVSGASKFQFEWEKTTTYKINGKQIGYMIYGYDTDYINEDYVWTVGDECSTQAFVKRDGHDTAYISGSIGQQYLYGKIEVHHITYNVNYKIQFTATYSGPSITESTKTSAVK